MTAGTPTELCRQPVESASPGLHACRCTLESLGCMYGLSEKSGGVRHTSGERLLRLRLRAAGAARYQVTTSWALRATAKQVVQM